MKFSGVFPPLTTPFAEDDSLALDRLRENVARYNRTRLAGYVVSGSTGESVLLDRGEIENVWETVREAAAPEKCLIAGTGAESTAETIERTRRAAEIGYQAALVKTPHYYKPQITPELLIEHFLRVADASPIPVLLYSVPQFTGVAIEAAVVVRLAQHPNIAGIKESSGSVQRVSEIIAAAPDEFETLVGSASTFYASLAIGAVGGILALACVFPELCIELYESTVVRDEGRAVALQRQLLAPALTIVSKHGVPGVKYAMDQLGYFGGPPRRPLLPLDDAARRDVDAVLAAVASDVSPV